MKFCLFLLPMLNWNESSSLRCKQDKVHFIQRITFCFVCVCVGPSAESGAHTCLRRHPCRCSHGFEHPVSLFLLNQQCFPMFHLFQVTGILPTLLATFRCVSYLNCSCVFWVTFGVWLCLLLISFLCFLGDVWCVVVSVTCVVLVFFGKRKWFRVLWKFLRSTRIVCGRCSRR